MNVLRMTITVTQMLSASTLKVASSVDAGQDMKEVVKYAQVHNDVLVYFVYESVHIE